MTGKIITAAPAANMAVPVTVATTRFVLLVMAATVAQQC